MNNKGFTLVELLAVLVLLSIVVGITISVFNVNLGDSKKKTEEVFVDTIKDSLDMYLTSRQARSLNFSTQCSDMLQKTHGNVKVYKVSTNFKSVIESEYKPITQKDLVNPADEDLKCEDADEIEITIYRDSDYVYYYRVEKNEFNCLKNIGTLKEILNDGTEVYYPTVITNLPEGFNC